MDPTPAGNIPNRQPLVLAFTITMTVLATVAVALRIIARRISAADFWYDDYTCLFALVGITHLGKQVDIRLMRSADHVLFDRCYRICRWLLLPQTSPVVSLNVLRSALWIWLPRERS